MVVEVAGKVMMMMMMMMIVVVVWCWSTDI